MYSGAVSIVDTGTSTLLQLAPDCEFRRLDTTGILPVTKSVQCIALCFVCLRNCCCLMSTYRVSLVNIALFNCWKVFVKLQPRVESFRQLATLAVSHKRPPLQIIIKKHYLLASLESSVRSEIACLDVSRTIEDNH